MENEFDMEMTPERESYIKKTLIMLLADQLGQEVKSVTVRPANQSTKEPA